MENPICVSVLLESEEGGASSEPTSGIVAPAAAEVPPVVDVVDRAAAAIHVTIAADVVGVQAGFAPPAFGQPAQPAADMATTMTSSTTLDLTTLPLDLMPPPPVLENPIRVGVLLESEEGGASSGPAAGIVAPAAAEVPPVVHGAAAVNDVATANQGCVLA